MLSHVALRIEAATVGGLFVFGAPGAMSASLIGRSGSSAFRTIHRSSVDVAHGLVLLFGNRHQGPSIMGFENEAERSIGRPCRRLAAGPSGHTISPHPSSREGHHSTARWNSRVLLFNGVWLSCRHGFFPAPAERGSVDPDAVHDYGQPTRQRHDCFLHAAAPGPSCCLGGWVSGRLQALRESHAIGRRPTRGPKARLPPRQTAVVAPVHSRGHFVPSWVVALAALNSAAVRRQG